MKKGKDGGGRARQRSSRGFRNGGGTGSERLEGTGTQRHHDLRSEQGELAVEERPARPGGSPVELVVRGSALDQVEETGRTHIHAGGRERPVEALTGPPDEREALSVLLGPWGLPHEDHSGL
jgi:hypothetical protein